MQLWKCLFLLVCLTAQRVSCVCVDGEGDDCTLWDPENGKENENTTTATVPSTTATVPITSALSTAASSTTVSGTTPAVDAGTVTTPAAATTTSPPAGDSTTTPQPAANITAESTVTGQSTSPNTGTSQQSTNAQGTTTVGTTTVPTTTAAPTIAMEYVTFPNALTPMDAKHILQEAVLLTNHINDLSNQIQLLQNSIDPNNSYLITDLTEMSVEADQMSSTLASLQATFTTANDALVKQQQSYNNASRVMSCMTSQCVPTTTAAPTTTAIPTTPTTSPPPGCNSTYTANSTTQTVSFNTTAGVSVCSTVIQAASGTVVYDISVTIASSGGMLSVIDVKSGAGIANYTSSTNATGVHSNSTVIRFDAVPPSSVTYILTYRTYDPCLTFGCATNATCSLNSQAQPYCVCNNTGPCTSLDSSGKICSTIDPCAGRGTTKCNAAGSNCATNPDSLTCSYMCTAIPPAGVAEDVTRGFFHRWVY